MDPTEVIFNWIRRIQISRKELGGNRICPFAKNIKNIVVVDKLHVDMFTDIPEVFIYIENSVNSTFEEIDNICRQLKNKYPNYVFLPDHPDKKTYINGVFTGNGHFPCIICQTSEELHQARAKLKKTDYYSYWDKAYLDEINNY